MRRLRCAFPIIVLLFVILPARETRSQARPGRPGRTFEGALPQNTTEPEAGPETIRRGRANDTLSKLEAKASQAEAKRNWKDAALSYNQATAAARLSGQLDKAVSDGNKAIENAEKAADPLLQVRATLALATVYWILGQHAKVKALVEKGMEITKAIDKTEFNFDMYNEIAAELLRAGETEQAIRYISESLRIQEAQLDNLKTRSQGEQRALQTAQRRIVLTLEQLGNAYKRAGSMEEAIGAFEKALGTIKESKLKFFTEDNVYFGLGLLYRGKKDFARAFENLQKSLEIAEGLRHAFGIQRAASQLADLLLQEQKPAQAIPFYKKAIDTVESTRSLLDSEELRSSFFEDKREIYAGMILAQIAAGNLEEAFNTNERARSRAFLDILGSKVQLARGGSFLEEERSLQARISALRAQWQEESQSEDDEEARENPQLKQEIETAERSYNDFIVRVRKQNAEQASLMNVEPLTLKQLQALLDPGVTVLEYFVPRGKAMLWVVEKDRIRFVPLSIFRKDLVTRVGLLRKAIEQTEEKDKFNQLSRQIYRLLIQPALPHIRGKELLIIPHDVLHYLPFQALLSPRGRYLIQDYPIYYLSSASLMQFTKQKKRSSQEKALVLANPNLGDEAYNLRFAEREAREIAEVYPRSAVFVRAEATKSKAVALSPNYDLLHFAVHAELKEDDPLNSALLLAKTGGEDGRLKVFEIFALNLKADTVVLSACETGLGKINNGDELIGLIRAFVYAGTPSVITTLWKVNDRASYELMRAFYANLKNAKKSEALRQAQLKTMGQFPEPFFWAAYSLTGEP